MPIDANRPLTPLISCVVPAYNEAANIQPFVAALYAELLQHSKRVEIVIVNDGSKDDTAAKVLEIIDRYPLRFIDLSRNFGKEAALTAGIDHAEGDVVVLIDADFQHPIAVIGDFLAQWRLGYDMVFGVRVDRKQESMVKRAGTRVFYSLLNRLSSVHIPPNAGDFRLLDRKVVLALRSMPERNRFMKGLYSWVGFRSLAVPFEVQERADGVSSFSLSNLWHLAVTGLVSFSDVPLRMWGAVGVVVSSISFIYALWIIAKTLIVGADVPGWATQVVAVMFLGGIQLMSIGILGEYIARIFNEVKQRPPYLIGSSHGFDKHDSRRAP